MSVYNQISRKKPVEVIYLWLLILLITSNYCKIKRYSRIEIWNICFVNLSLIRLWCEAKFQFQKFLVTTVRLNQDVFSKYDFLNFCIVKSISPYIFNGEKFEMFRYIHVHINITYVCQSVFTLSHRQGQIESDFSINKEIITEIFNRSHWEVKEWWSRAGYSITTRLSWNLIRPSFKM